MIRLKAVIQKEFAHILRDPMSLTIVIIMPVVLMFIFGYAINFDLDIVSTGIIDYSDCQYSKELIKKFANNDYFEITNLKYKYADPLKGGNDLLRSGILDELIIIPSDFSHKINSNQKANIGVIIDGSDSNIANLIYQYNELIIFDFIADIFKMEKMIDVNTKIYFNPEGKSAFFFIPGLLALLLLMTSAMLTSVSVAREKESGSIELLFISPLRSYEIILGKTIPYIFVALLNCTFILLLARFWFLIPFRGNVITLYLFALVYIMSGLALGILISTISESQSAAMFATLLITLLPSLMLSGFIFPLDSMGFVLRKVSYVIPATYFLKIVRGIILKGSEMQHFYFEGAVLLGISILLLTIASKKFQKLRRKIR